MGYHHGKEYAEAHKEHINRFKMAHCIGVAEYMRENAEKYGLNPDEMYTIGLLHDIGYLNGRAGHEETGLAILKGIGLPENSKSAFAISQHGKNLYQVEEDNKAMYNDGLLKGCPEIVLLCEADMSIDARGFNVGFEERLKDIGTRYGFDHIAYQTASATVAFVKEKLAQLESERPQNIAEIYQLKSEARHEYGFASTRELSERGLEISRENYERIYSLPITQAEAVPENRTVLLEELYTKFNINRPEDFTGHSLSVSDVITIRDGKTSKSYYVDDIGFSPISDFEREEPTRQQHLRKDKSDDKSPDRV